MEVDSNHRSNLQQIYSLSPLATRESTHLNLYALTSKTIIAQECAKSKMIYEKNLRKKLTKKTFEKTYQKMAKNQQSFRLFFHPVSYRREAGA